MPDLIERSVGLHCLLDALRKSILGSGQELKENVKWCLRRQRASCFGMRTFFRIVCDIAERLRVPSRPLLAEIV